MNDKICPACGSHDLKTEKNSILVQEPFGGEETVELEELVCTVCGSRGDFSTNRK